MTDFPISPIINQIHTYGGITYKWNSEKWVITPGAVRHNINDVPFGTVDLSKGTFHKISTNESCVVSFENIPTGSSRWGMEIDINGVTKYDLVNSSGTAPIASLSIAAADTTPWQLFFKPTGDKLYVVGNTNDRVNTYNLTTPWNIATAVITSNTFILSGFDSSPIGLTFDPTGRYMYINGSVTRNVFQFELSERWNVSTATLSKTKSMSTEAAYSGPYSIQFSPDGDKMFILAWTSSTAGQIFIYEFTLSTPWDVSTATYTTGDRFQVGLLDNSAVSFTFRPDGRKMYMIGQTNDIVYQYTLSTPWKVNTAVSDGVSFVQAATAEATPTNIMFNPDGSSMFISGNTLDTLREYRTSYSRAAYSGTFTFPSNVIWNNNTTPTITSSSAGQVTTSTTSIVDFTTPDGGSTIYASEKFNKPISKTSSATPSKFITNISSSTLAVDNTWSGPWNYTITSFRNQDARFVLEFTSTTTAATQLDQIVFDGNTYGFENTNHGFQYGYGAGTATYQTITTWTALPVSTTGSTSNAWAALSSAVIAPGVGTWSIYGHNGTAGNKLFLRSPIITLGSNPTLSVYRRLPTIGTHNYYITNI